METKHKQTIIAIKQTAETYEVSIQNIIHVLNKKRDAKENKIDDYNSKGEITEKQEDIISRLEEEIYELDSVIYTFEDILDNLQNLISSTDLLE